MIVKETYNYMYKQTFQSIIIHIKLPLLKSFFQCTDSFLFVLLKLLIRIRNHQNLKDTESWKVVISIYKRKVVAQLRGGS
jgi:hypothetical protein